MAEYFYNRGFGSSGSGSGSDSSSSSGSGAIWSYIGCFDASFNIIDAISITIILYGVLYNIEVSHNLKSVISNGL